jgi:hypothetical protein
LKAQHRRLHASQLGSTMKFVSLLSLLSSPLSVSAQNPLSTVISLLDDLTAKVTKDGEVEAKAYKEFVAWCDDASRNTAFEIKTGDKTKAKLTAAIAKATGDAEAASVKIEELASSIASDEADLKKATTIRDKELADFKSNEAELMDSVDTLSRAISIIEREMEKNPALAQMDASKIGNIVQTLSAVVDAASFNVADKQRLTALVQSSQTADSDDDDVGAPAAATYKSHSKGIVDVLEDLKEKADEQLAALRKAEINAQHNYNMLKQSLEDQIDADTKDMEEQKKNKASLLENKATYEGDLTRTIKLLTDANSALGTVRSDCMTTAADHDATVAGRKEELKVIAHAKQILSETTSGAESQTYSFLQGLSGSRLSTTSGVANAEVVALIRRLAKDHHSSALAQLASRVASAQRFGSTTGEDAFAKIKGLISDMISKLEAEAGSEATEKAYCDEQMSKTEAKKEELEHDVSKFSSTIDQGLSAITTLKETVQQLQSELSALAKSQAEMDRIRRETHAAYSEATTDLELGLKGVRKALGVLRDYYGGASLLQDGTDMQQPAPPVKHSAASGAGNSIIDILEVVESDFAKNLAQEEAEEADAQTEYEKTTQENAITRTTKEQDVKYSVQFRKTTEKNVDEVSADRENANTELSAVLEYYTKIKERCIAKPETYEERKERRTAEIVGLKEALTILEQETALTQRSKRGLKAHFLGARV